ncbi:MAG: hypothetical protein IPL01_14695 [Acidobacteria bacterium]|nr:hypothetical protein [Acidobacteriota bacterium]
MPKVTGIRVSALTQQIIMENSGNRGNIPAYEACSVLSAQPLDHAVGRCDGQRNQNDKGEHTQKDERPIVYVFDDSG